MKAWAQSASRRQAQELAAQAPLVGQPPGFSTPYIFATCPAAWWTQKSDFSRTPEKGLFKMLVFLVVSEDHHLLTPSGFSSWALKRPTCMKRFQPRSGVLHNKRRTGWGGFCWCFLHVWICFRWPCLNDTSFCDHWIGQLNMRWVELCQVSYSQNIWTRWNFQIARRPWWCTRVRSAWVKRPKADAWGFSTGDLLELRPVTCLRSFLRFLDWKMCQLHWLNDMEWVWNDHVFLPNNAEDIIYKMI